MPSSEILTFRASVPAMPPHMPVDELNARRKEMEAMLVEKYPVPPDVKMEPTTCGDTPAIWYRPAKALKKRVVLYIHGGGFMWNSALDHQGMIGAVALAAQADTLAFDYGYAPFMRFPGQINQCVDMYQRLLKAGHAPSNIAVYGDSAGGGLALSLLVALKQRDLPMPGCVVSSSAWVDMTNSGESLEWVTNDQCVSREGLEVCLESYLPEGQDRTDPLLSPLFADPTGFPPLLIQVGGAEALLSDSVRFATKADGAGVDATLEVYSGCMHLWQWWVPGSPEAKAAYASAGRFIDRHIPRP